MGKLLPVKIYMYIWNIAPITCTTLLQFTSTHTNMTWTKNLCLPSADLHATASD